MFPPDRQSASPPVFMRKRRRYSIYVFCLALPLWLAYRFWRSISSGDTGGAEAVAVGLRTRESAKARDGYVRDGEHPRGPSAGTEPAEGGDTAAEAPPPFPAEYHFVSRSPELGKYPTGPEIVQLLQVSASTGREPDHGNHSSRSSSNNTSSLLSLSSKAKANAADNSDAFSAIARTGSGGSGGSGGASRCAGIDVSVLADGMMACGAPLSSPCFDRDRCKPRARGGPGPSMYIYDAICSLADSSALPPSGESLMLSHTWREAAREAGVLSETYQDACIFVHVNKLIDRPPCASTSPLWNGGANHVMVDLTDRTR